MNHNEKKEEKKKEKKKKGELIGLHANEVKKEKKKKLRWICLGTYTTHSQHNVSVHLDWILFHVAGVV